MQIATATVKGHKKVNPITRQTVYSSAHALNPILTIWCGSRTDRFLSFVFQKDRFTNFEAVRGQNPLFPMDHGQNAAAYWLCELSIYRPLTYFRFYVLY